ncbi:MAG TPA: prephenate dehydrogenase/arogenate dehydrogenase family protein, partial [Methylophilaceae bacterium]|nr:prephenate dehydrogenase/arogenate dehydrogenase family protein [Methylophilaceae bacterium]
MCHMLQSSFFQLAFKPLNKLLIFGVGLIGGSLALALKRAHAVQHVVGIGRAGDSLQSALDLGVIDEAADDLVTALAATDMVVIATPVAQIPDILTAITPYLGANTVVTDAGSTKCDVIRHARSALPAHFPRFVAGHPIAGAEKSGVTAALPDLFRDKNVVLTPTAETDPQAVEAVSRMWQAAGANICRMSAETHDGIFAAVSHLPHLLAFALVDDLSRRADAEQLFGFAASGFRDFTRIAGSSPEMWRDISLANREALLAELDAYRHDLDQLRAMLQQGDGNGL